MTMTDVIIDDQNIDLNTMINNEFNNSVEKLISHIARECTDSPVSLIKGPSA